MALTESSMINLGTYAPDFELFDTMSQSRKSLFELKGEKLTLIIFICNHCPYVVHVMPEIQKLYADYAQKGVNFIAISSNDIVAYPQDGPAYMPNFMKNYDLNFPYLFDADQNIAKAFDAACTPDFYMYDANLKLIYRGRLDASRPRTETLQPLNGQDIRAALNAQLAGHLISEIQYPSMGCNIKWKV